MTSPADDLLLSSILWIQLVPPPPPLVTSFEVAVPNIKTFGDLLAQDLPLDIKRDLLIRMVVNNRIHERLLHILCRDLLLFVLILSLSFRWMLRVDVSQELVRVVPGE